MDNIETLFFEVTALANRLKRPSAQLQKMDTLRGGAASLLRILGQQGPQTVPQIARLRFTSRQNIQILANRLVKDGWVELTENPAHKRSGLVQLTDKGRHLLDSSMDQTTQFLDTLSSHATAAEVESAAALLRRLRKLLSQSPGQVEEQDRQESPPRSGPVEERQPSASAAAEQEKQSREAEKPAQAPDEDPELPFNLL